MPPPASSEARPSQEAHATLALLAPIGVGDADEGRSLRAHLATGCPTCEAGLAHGWRAVDVLALATPRLAPSSAARARLLSAVASEAPIARRRSRPSAGPWLMAAGIAAIAALAGAFASSELSTLREDRQSLALEKAALEDEHASLAQSKRELELALSGLEARADALASRNAVLEDAVEVAGGPDMESIELSGESDFEQAHVRVLIDPSLEQVVMLGQKLPAPPPGRTYQLWVVEDGQPSSLGTFAPDAEGRALQLERGLLDWPSRRVFAVSVEPEGGVLKPSGPVVLSGS